MSGLSSEAGDLARWPALRSFRLKHEERSSPPMKYKRRILLIGAMAMALASCTSTSSDVVQDQQSSTVSTSSSDPSPVPTSTSLITTSEPTPATATTGVSATPTTSMTDPSTPSDLLVGLKSLDCGVILLGNSPGAFEVSGSVVNIGAELIDGLEVEMLLINVQGEILSPFIDGGPNRMPVSPSILFPGETAEFEFP